MDTKLIHRFNVVFSAAEEVDLGDDLKHWEKLSDGERHFIKHVLAFFAASDGIVLENLACRFMSDVQISEVSSAYYARISKVIFKLKPKSFPLHFYRPEHFMDFRLQWKTFTLVINLT